MRKKMETKINKHNLFKFLKRDLREAGLNQDDWLSYLQLLDAPDLLNGIYLVSQQILKISKLMTAPIVSEDSIEIVSILSRCSAIVDSNQMLLRKEFGDCVLKKPTTAKSNPLYYLLFHGCKPEMRKEYYKLLMWMFIAFNKRKENNTLSKNSNYHYGLAARSISDEHSIGNILEEFDTSITYTSDVITELRRISESSHLVRLEPKTKISLSKIITLLSPGLRGKNKEIEHSKHNRSYFLPTPRRGYIPNIARIINRNLIKLKIRSWSPKEILSGDIQDSQLNNYAPAGEPADEVKTGLMSTEIREHKHRPELHKYKLIAIANAIAKGNQTIPNQLSLASSTRF